MKTLAKFRFVLILLASVFFFSACNPLELKNKAGLQVITNDVAVSIFLNEQFLGKTPFLTKDLKPGDYTIKIEPEDSQLVAYETSIKLRKGMLSVVTWTPGKTLAESGGVIYELEKLPDRNKTEISVMSIPDGAIISLDNGSKEFAPFTSENEQPGHHEFEATLPSYVTQQHTINLDKGFRLSILVKLAKDNVIDQENIPVNQPNPSPSPTIEHRSLNESATPSGSVQGVTTATSSAPVRKAATSIDLSGKKVLIKPTGYIENGKEVVKVRAAANSGAAVIGLAESGKEYPYLEEQTANWLKLDIGTKQGWVTTQYAQIQP